MSKLQEKLSRLLALATLKEGEADNDGRVNEARTASFLLLKTCQENGVKITFKLSADQRPATPPPPGAGPFRHPRWPNNGDPFTPRQNATAQETMRDFEDMFTNIGLGDLLEIITEQQKRRAGFRPKRQPTEPFTRPKGHPKPTGWRMGVVSPLNPDVYCFGCLGRIGLNETYLTHVEGGVAGKRQHWHPRCSRDGREALGL